MKTSPAGSCGRPRRRVDSNHGCMVKNAEHRRPAAAQRYSAVPAIAGVLPAGGGQACLSCPISRATGSR